MAGKGRQVTIQFLGDSKSFERATDRAANSTSKFGGTLRKMGKAALIGFAGATIAAGKAAYEFAEAAIEDEKSAALLAKTLKNTTGATKAQVAAVEDWISKQGELYGFADDELRPALSKLAAATGDITKSQQLASLAMDVSTGTGKDLQSITLALAKAQTGSLAGLGRLGVATKNAAGETKTLDQITADLTKKYKGSAATAADTAAGKFERVKLQLSETAESIGYKLLPVANDLGDWLIGDGIPALEGLARAGKREVGPVLRDLRDWVSDNKDEFADMATEIAGNALPILRSTGRVVGDVVGFFNDLPAPVREFAVQAGAAAVLLPKLSAALGGMKLQEFASNVGNAESRTAALRSAARAAAGAGGLMLLLDASNRTNDGMAALERTAGGAATGFAVAGPWGAAIGGAAGLIASIATSSNEAREGAEKAYKAIGKVDPLEAASDANEALSDTLDRVTGAYTGATRAAIQKQLADNGMIQAASKYGVSARELVNAALGQKDAISRLTPVVEDYNSQIGDLDSKIKALKESSDSFESVPAGGGKYYKRMTTDVLEQITALEKQKKALETSRNSIQQMPKDLREMGKETRANAAATADYTGKLKGLPANVKTQILQTGIEPSTRAIADLARRYELTPKQVKTLIQASGADTSARRVQILIDKIKALQDKTVTVTTRYETVRTPSGKDVPLPGGGGSKKSDPREVGTDATGRLTLLQGGLGAVEALEKGGKRAEIAGNALLISITKGLKKGKRTLGNVLDGLQDYIQTKSDKLTEILSDRSSFVESFRDAFSQSIFSAQFSDAEGNQVPPTIQRMLDFAKQQQATAKNLAANINSLISKGLSRNLLSQLASQGQSGIDQIAALASGSASDIAAFNSINADINKTLDELGLGVWETLNPDKNGQIDLLKTQVAQGEQMVAALNRVANQENVGEVKIKGTDLVILLKRQERAEGKQYLVS